MQVLDIIYTAYRLCGVLAGAGRNVSQSEIDDAFDALNAMLDAWNTERLIAYRIVRSTFSLVAGTQAYTIGTGATFNVARPIRIERAGLIYLANAAQPLELPIEILTDAQWAAVPVKNISSPIPLSLWYNANFPLGEVNFWPVPSEVNNVALYLWQQLAQFTDPTDTAAFPPGYLQAIQYNLAVELAPRYPRAQMNPIVFQKADKYKAQIKSVNIPLLDMQCDPAVLTGRAGIWDWRTGDYHHRW